MDIELKIGIVLNYKNAEKKKDELFTIRSKDYLQGTDKKYCIGNKVPADVAIGMYLKNKYPNNPDFKIAIDFITPEEISLQRFKKNDIVFVIIYDLLECFHLGSKANFKKFKTALKSADNVYPPYAYQKFINNKCTYYKYLADKKIPVAPTHCITKQKWLTRDSDAYTNKLINKIQGNKWESIIAKPVYGQESKDFAKFMAPKKPLNCDSGDCSEGEFCNKTKLKKYLSKNIPKYKSIIIQEYIPGFDKDNPEYRMYFIDGIYAYCVVTTNHIVQTPRQEGGKYKVSKSDWDYLMKFGRRVMDSLPKFNLPGLNKSPILTRIDVGTGLKDVPKSFFVNEVEFVPSLYIEDQKFPVVEEIAESLLGVAFEYHFSGEPNVKF
jgi:hypothetical protein